MFHQPPSTTCQFRHVASGYCIDINGQSYSPGAGLILWECTGQWNQVFEITPTGKCWNRMENVCDSSYAHKHCYVYFDPPYLSLCM